MDDSSSEDISQKKLPFNNLFLNSGFIAGFNDWWMYLITICVTISCYALAPVLTSFPILMNTKHKLTELEALTEDPNKLFDYEFMGVDRNLVLIALLGIFVITALGFALCIKR